MMKPFRRFGPKEASHNSVGKPCPACHLPFKAGDYTAVILLGPGPDQEQQRLAREGKQFTGKSIEVHYLCATGRPE